MIEEAGPVVTVTLPAGFYHLAARIGTARRGYTLNLSEGATVELHLPPEAAEPGRRTLHLTHPARTPATDS